MPTLHIVLDGDDAFPHLRGRECFRTDEFAVSALEGGMTSGQPSVAVIIELDDGRWVFAETSLKLFLAAADAFKGKYGDPRQEPVMP
jgi:hypothetical protein